MNFEERKQRRPVGNSTDLIDENDMKVAKEMLIKERIQQRQEIDHWFGLLVVESKPEKGINLEVVR